MTQPRPPLEEMTLRQLRRVASQYNISRYSRMRKAQLLAAIEKIEQEKSGIKESTSSDLQDEQEVEAAKFTMGVADSADLPLTAVDENLGELPGGYGVSRLVLLPRDPQWAYTYWYIPDEHKQKIRRQGGEQLTLRIYDVTNLDVSSQTPPCIQEYPCDETAQEWYLPIPVSDRDYAAEIGYRCQDGRWLSLTSSAPIHIPPVYPSDWVEDVFVTLNWEEDIINKNVYQFTSPHDCTTDLTTQIALVAEKNRVAGSIFGSNQHVAGSIQQKGVPIFASGVGIWSIPNVSGLNMSGISFASQPPEKARKFWLIADAELIVYGATEPDAKVSIGGRPIKLNADGTFRFQVSFQDGVLDYPIEAVAADGEQKRSIQMKFTRETPVRDTNMKEEAVEENWFL